MNEKELCLYYFRFSTEKFMPGFDLMRALFIFFKSIAKLLKLLHWIVTFINIFQHMKTVLDVKFQKNYILLFRISDKVWLADLCFSYTDKAANIKQTISV